MILVALLAGCRREAPRPMEPLAVPAAAEIAYINVERLKLNGERQNEFKISDRPRIEAILSELRLNNTSYSSEMDGRAPQELAIALIGYERMETMIWVGDGWLGGVDRKHQDPKGGLASHYRKLSRDQYLRLVALVMEPTKSSP